MADKNYEKHTWTVSEFQKGDQKFIDNLNHMEDGIGGVSDKYVKEAVVDNDRATIEFTDQDGNKTTYYPITAESGTTKAYVDDGDASVTVTPLSSLVGVEYEEDEIRGFRIGDPSGEAGTGVSYKIRETARAEELPSELTSPMTWTQFCTTLQGLIDQYATQFRGRTYQGNIIITSGFPGQGSSQVGLAISSTIINDYAAKIDIYSTTIQPYHWEMHTKIGGTPNIVPSAILTCQDTDAERARHYTKEIVYKVNGDNSVEQIWRPALVHCGGNASSVSFISDSRTLSGMLCLDGVVYGLYIRPGLATFSYGWNTTTSSPRYQTITTNGTDNAVLFGYYGSSEPIPVYTTVARNPATHECTVSFYTNMQHTNPYTGAATLVLHQVGDVS